MKAPVVADADDALGLAYGVDRRLGLLLGEGEWLLAIDVLTGGGGGLDLFQMAGRRGRQRNRVDLGVGENLFVGLRDTERVLFGEGFDVRRHGAGLQHGEAHGVAAAGKRLHHRLAPGAKPDNRRVDHVTSTFAYLGHVSMARMTQDSIQNTQYSMPPMTQIHFRVTL